MIADKKTLPSGTVVRCVFGTRTVEWAGDVCFLLSDVGDCVNSAVEGRQFGGPAYEVVGVLPSAKRIKVKPGDWLKSLSSAERKECAVHRGLFGYFPDACALVARHSVRANEKHNPGQPVHWSREKSKDHDDCIARHTVAIAANPDALEGDQYEVVSRAWRALAALQIWVEGKLARGEKV